MAKLTVPCPFCDDKVALTARMEIDEPARADTSPDAKAIVVNVTPVFEPDLMEQFTPHLRDAHPTEYSRYLERASAHAGQIAGATVAGRLEEVQP